MKLHEKVALVTGSVGGIGWEIVQAFAEEGSESRDMRFVTIRRGKGGGKIGTAF
jgi:NAD(P)-dependent dehydrogenase (short-subunit alcohol dehydrogenase family)